MTSTRNPQKEFRCQMELVVCTSDPEEHRRTVDTLSAAWPTKVRLLELRSLRQFAFDESITAKVVLLCHLCEGRTILTDADGLYNAFLVEAVKLAEGRVYVGLTGLAGTQDLADRRVVDELVASGQDSIQAFHTARRLMTWDVAPSPSQLDHLLSYDQLPPLNLPPGVLANATQRRSSFCPIL